MAKVTLIAPKYPEGVNNNPPLGIAYIASYLEKNGIDVEIIDDEIERMDEDRWIERLKKLESKVVGITSTTPCIPDVERISNLIKKYTDAIVVLGGVHSSAMPKECIKYLKNVDFAVRGEGEITMLKLCKKFFADDMNFDDVKGIAYRKNADIVYTGDGEYIKNLDELPSPARKLLDMETYIDRLTKATEKMFIDVLPVFSNKKLRATHIFVGRGCPYNCTYCAGKVALGRRFRLRSVENVIDEITVLIRDYKINTIFLQDDTPTISKKWLKEFCRRLKEEKLPIHWAGNARADNLDGEAVKMMYESGCRCLGIGVESYSQSFLNILKKGETIEDIKRAFKLCKKYKIRTFGYFMFNLPEQTLEDMEKTVDFVKELDPDVAQFAVLTPYPGTEIFRKYVNKENDDWRRYLYMHEIVYNFTKDIPDAEILSFFEKAQNKYKRQQIIHFNIKYVKLMLYRIRTDPKRVLYTLKALPKTLTS